MSSESYYSALAGVSTHLGPFPGDSADAVGLVEQGLICCRKQGVFKQTPVLEALPPQRGERLALVRNRHSPADHTSQAVTKYPPLALMTASVDGFMEE